MRTGCAVNEGGAPAHAGEAKPWQGAPKGGYFLASGMDSWPELATVGLTQVGAFVSMGIWAHNAKTTRIHKNMWRAYRGEGCDTKRLERAGLLTPAGDYHEIPTIPVLRGARARRGRIMMLSRLVAQGTEAALAGLAPFGLWCLAASWSLGTDTPGYIPTEQALRLGKAKHIAALWDTRMWIVDEDGFHMAQGAHPIERWWKVGRDDERAVIRPAVRQAVFERDGWKCVLCDSTDDLALDHVFPWSLGGADTEGNLRVLCRLCNSSKGARIE